MPKIRWLVEALKMEERMVFDMVRRRDVGAPGGSRGDGSLRSCFRKEFGFICSFWFVFSS